MNNFVKPSKPLAQSAEYVETFKHVTEDQKDPNRELERAMREVLAVAAGPIVGQTRDLNFLCRGDDEFEAVKEAIHQTFVEHGVLQADEFDVDKNITTPEKDGNPSYISGSMRLTIPANRYSNSEISAIASKAYKVASGEDTAPSTALEQG